MKRYNDSEGLIKKASKEYLLIAKKEKYATRKIITQILQGKHDSLFKDVSSYLLCFYKNELNLYIKKELKEDE